MWRVWRLWRVQLITAGSDSLLHAVAAAQGLRRDLRLSLHQGGENHGLFQTQGLVRILFHHRLDHRQGEERSDGGIHGVATGGESVARSAIGKSGLGATRMGRGSGVERALGL